MTPSNPVLRAVGIGAVCGVASGLLGIGGAVIMVPLLGALLGLSQHRAQGTSLVVTLFTGTAAAIGYAQGGHLDFRLAVILVAGSVVGSPLGARWTRAIPASTLRRAFGVLIIVVGIRLLLVNLPEGQLLSTVGLPGIIAHVLMGFAVGIASGFFGIGGGVVLVPALVLLSGVPQHTAQGIALLFLIPTAMVGGWTHYKLGNVDTRIVLPLAAGSAGVAFASSLVASLLPAQTLRLLFGCLLVVVGLRLALIARRGTGKTVKQDSRTDPPAAG